MNKTKLFSFTCLLLCVVLCFSSCAGQRKTGTVHSYERNEKPHIELNLSYPDTTLELKAASGVSVIYGVVKSKSDEVKEFFPNSGLQYGWLYHEVELEILACARAHPGEKPGDVVTVAELGGENERYSFSVSNTPTMNVGDEVIAFGYENRFFSPSSLLHVVDGCVTVPEYMLPKGALIPEHGPEGIEVQFPVYFQMLKGSAASTRRTDDLSCEKPQIELNPFYGFTDLEQKASSGVSVIHGVVRSKSDEVKEYIPDGDVPYAWLYHEVEIEVLDCLRPHNGEQPGDVITVGELGGENASYSFSMKDTPTMNVGDEVIVFGYENLFLSPISILYITDGIATVPHYLMPEGSEGREQNSGRVEVALTKYLEILKQALAAVPDDMPNEKRHIGGIPEYPYRNLEMEAAAGESVIYGVVRSKGETVKEGYIDRNYLTNFPWGGDEGLNLMLYHDVEIEVLDCIHPFDAEQPGDTILVGMPGGENDQYIFTLSNAPKLEVGDEVIVFGYENGFPTLQTLLHVKDGIVTVPCDMMPEGSGAREQTSGSVEVPLEDYLETVRQAFAAAEAE